MGFVAKFIGFQIVKKKFQDRLTVDKVRARIEVVHFYGPPCTCICI